MIFGLFDASGDGINRALTAHPFPSDCCMNCLFQLLLATNIAHCPFPIFLIVGVPFWASGLSLRAPWDDFPALLVGLDLWLDSDPRDSSPRISHLDNRAIPFLDGSKHGRRQLSRVRTGHGLAALCEANDPRRRLPGNKCFDVIGPSLQRGRLLLFPVVALIDSYDPGAAAARVVEHRFGDFEPHPKPLQARRYGPANVVKLPGRGSLKLRLEPLFDPVVSLTVAGGGEHVIVADDARHGRDDLPGLAR